MLLFRMTMYKTFVKASLIFYKNKYVLYIAKKIKHQKVYKLCL